MDLKEDRRIEREIETRDRDRLDQMTNEVRADVFRVNRSARVSERRWYATAANELEMDGMREG